MSDATDHFVHGEFWDEYSRRWDEEVRPRIEGTLLGEEWARPERTHFVYDRFAAPFLSESARVIEIGPGGGKFSRLLVERCAELILVDVSREMLRRANQACGGRAREVIAGDCSIAEIESDSIDLVFSYDVFIHLESEEVFRYFAEVNRVLRPDGIFSVHTSSFESRLGFLSYLQQLRDHPTAAGRYGGRMYPLNESILRRFAEHSGFEVEDVFARWDDKDILFALRKSRPARPWTFLIAPELNRRFELAERAGGSDRRELYAARSLESAEPRTLLVGDAEDPVLQAVAAAAVPDHPCLGAPLDFETGAGLGIVQFPGAHGRALPRHRDLVAADLGHWRRQAGRLLEGLLEAHAAGLAHGEFGPEFVLVDVPAGQLKLYGLAEPAEASAEARRSDLASVADVLAEVSGPPGSDGAESLAEIVAELGTGPRASLVERAVEILLA